jgi:hypothetical protein
VIGIILLVGLVGGVALAALAGARRTASTFAAYERDVHLSHLAVNTFIPGLDRVHAIERLPGVASSASYLGLDAYPVLHGKEVTEFQYNGVFGSLDGRFFRQDRATVVHGRLPGLDATDEVALSPLIAGHLGARIGDHLTYRFHAQEGGVVTSARLTVVGIIRFPPVIVDENDIIEGSLLSPAATKAHLDASYYTWQGIRLTDGVAGIDRFVRRLADDPTVNQLPPVVQRYDVTRTQVQRSVRPQAVALALFGAAAALAMIALAGQAVVRMVGSWGADRAALRGAGLARSQLAVAFSLDAAGALVLGTVVALAVAAALSPLAPVGGVRRIAPAAGVQLDLTVLLGGGGAMLALLLLLTGGVAWRAAQRDDSVRPGIRSSVASRASQAGLPVPVVVGTGFALDPSPVRGRGGGRSSVLGGVVAVAAVAAAAVFGQSLGGLVSHPVRYGWSWDRMLVAEAGYGSFHPDLLDAAIARERGITAWATLTFAQGTVAGQSLPVIGLDAGRGRIEPSITDGRTVRSRGEVVLGRTTLRSLHRSVGDQVRVTVNGRSARLRIVGLAAMPSIGQGGADHTSLGRGALMRFDDLVDLAAPGTTCLATEDALCAQVLVFDVARGSDGGAIAERIASVDPDGTPGGTYEQAITRSADISNYDQMRLLPLALAGALALAALVAFGFSLLATVQARGRELAVLRALGLTSRQLQTALVTQAVVTALVAVIIGLPLGVAAGRLQWIRFADNVGVVPLPVVAVPTLVAASIAAVLVSAMVAVLPARLAARATVGSILHRE